MTLPPRYEGNHSSNLVCKLKKFFYGLKQSPRTWFGRFIVAMKKLNYKQSNPDHTLNFKHSSSRGVTVLLVYVDDIIITGNDEGEIQNLSNCLAQEFDVKTLGRLKYFLGIEVAYSSKGIFISQQKYITDLLAETGKSGCKPANTPIDPNQKLCMADEENSINREMYQRLIGRPLYLTHTRPDISYQVSILSQFTHQPKECHLHAAYRVLHYLKGTPTKGVLFKRSGKQPPVILLLKKQNVVARSRAEAEIRALAQGICELLWVKNLLDELQIPLFSPLTIYCDNKSAINLVHNPVQHNRTKHVEIDRHFIKEKLEANVICISYIPTNKQLADMLTKGISGTQL
ncbi:unnamed protein product [Spirodela intermedia]|uniref:Reverse transcriptase Ty1/copia-type domain-containing protein n=1 Tax=Spirodela intermedia TaxID=51605 RepID=A0A7I8KQ54_SPIIN|nr:unnamed protein product [Spirodela intermedia]